MKKIILIILIFVLLLMIKNLIFSISDVLSNSTSLSNLNKNLENSKRENIYLQQKFEYVKSSEFIEIEARKRLGLVKAGEYVVVGAEPGTRKMQKEEKKEISNLQKWWKVFFK